MEKDELYKHKNAEKLTQLAISVLNRPDCKFEFEQLLAKLRLSVDDVLTSFLDYNIDVQYSEGNIVYTSLANRVVLHIHNLLIDSWHIERQKVMFELISLVNPETIADLGFGVPSKYVKELILNSSFRKLTFCDLYDAAFIFAETLLDMWNSDWRRIIFFYKTDMDDHEYIGDFDLYVWQDSIEHAKSPTHYLTGFVKKTRNDSRFILSLPIGPLIPRHYIAWRTEEDAETWLNNCGLLVDFQKTVFVNPEVDLFAHEIDLKYRNLVVLCHKKV